MAASSGVGAGLGPGRRLWRGLAGAWAPAVAARGLRHRCPHRPPAAEPAHGAARRRSGHAGPAAAAPTRIRPGLMEAVAAPVSPGAGCGAPRGHRRPALARDLAARHGRGRAPLPGQRPGRTGPGRPGPGPAVPGAGRAAGQLRAAAGPARHDSRRRVAAAARHQPGARMAGPGRAGIRDPAGPSRRARLEHMVVGGEQDPGLAQPASGAAPAPAAGRHGAALDGHAGLGPGLRAGGGRAAHPAAPARGPPPRRAIAAAGPGGAAQYAGRTGGRHGA